LKARLEAIRSASIEKIVIPNEQEVREKFLELCGTKLRSRAMRDYSRLEGLIKSHCLFNLWNRRDSPESKTITANYQDVGAAFRLYSEIVEAQELSLAPCVLDLFRQVIEPLLKDDLNCMGITFRDVNIQHIRAYGGPLSRDQWIREIAPTLEAAALIYQEQDPTDRRKLRIHSGEFKPKATKDIIAAIGGDPHTTNLNTPPPPPATISSQPDKVKNGPFACPI